MTRTLTLAALALTLTACGDFDEVHSDLEVATTTSALHATTENLLCGATTTWYSTFESKSNWWDTSDGDTSRVNSDAGRGDLVSTLIEGKRTRCPNTSGYCIRLRRDGELIWEDVQPSRSSGDDDVLAFEYDFRGAGIESSDGFVLEVRPAGGSGSSWVTVHDEKGWSISTGGGTAVGRGITEQDAGFQFDNGVDLRFRAYGNAKNDKIYVDSIKVVESGTCD